MKFFDSPQFLSSLLDSLVKIINKGYSKYLSQQLDNNVLNLVKPKIFPLMSLWVILGRLRNSCMENKFYSYLTDIKITVKEYEHLINVWIKFEMEKMKEYHGL